MKKILALLTLVSIFFFIWVYPCCKLHLVSLSPSFYVDLYNAVRVLAELDILLIDITRHQIPNLLLSVNTTVNRQNANNYVCFT